MSALVGRQALEAAIQARDGVEAQRLLNILSGAVSVPSEQANPEPTKGLPDFGRFLPDYGVATQSAPCERPSLERAVEFFHPGALSPRNMLEIIADMSVNMRAGGVSINAGFLEGLAGIILRTPFDELEALRRELIPSPDTP